MIPSSQANVLYFSAWAYPLPSLSVFLTLGCLSCNCKRETGRSRASFVVDDKQFNQAECNSAFFFAWMSELLLNTPFKTQFRLKL